MKVVSYALLCLIALISVSGCRDADTFMPEHRSIAFSVSDETQSTRGVPVTSVSGIPDIVLYGYYTGNGNSNKWDATESGARPDFIDGMLLTNREGELYPEYPVYWPASPDANVTFFAYSPAAGPENGLVVNAEAGIPSFFYTVPPRCEDQPDLMVSALKKDMNRNDGTGVHFTMRHVLTCIGFKVFGQGERITGIRITDVVTSGTLTVSAEGIPLWDTGESATGAFEAIVAEDVTADDSVRLANTGEGYLMMIPQRLAADARLIIGIEGREDVEFAIGGMNWSAGQRINYTIGIRPDAVILLTPELITVPSSGGFSQFNLLVGEDKASVPWSVSTPEDWIFLCDNAVDLIRWSEGAIDAASIRNRDGSVPGQTLSGSTPEVSVPGSGNTPLYLYVPGMNQHPASDRIGSIGLQPGGGQQRIVVRQLPPVLPSEMVTTAIPEVYVGAFWRSEQTGERIIRIPVGAAEAGLWSASVLWYDENWPLSGIYFSTEESEDEGITRNPDTELPADMNLLVSDRTFKVDGYHSSACGMAQAGGEIRFRVGLDRPFTSPVSIPARYAVILLRFAGLTKNHLIYLRQGEEPDYLFAPRDPYGKYTGITGRPAAARFTPYNLTADLLTGGSEINDHPSLPVRGAVFTRYPSQAGALFQWANENEPRRAYHPLHPTGAISSWQDNYSTGFWDTLQEEHETAPPGFRRPSDGAIDKNVPPMGYYAGNLVDSELRQSLYLNPPVANSSDISNMRWGYYADGFFDRRQIVDAPGNQGNPRSAVSVSNEEVAYAGALFINPVTNASIFFPATGYRAFRDGTLNSAGFYGNYWSGSSSDAAHSWFLDVDNVLMRPYTSFRSLGFSVRCVCAD